MHLTTIAAFASLCTLVMGVAVPAPDRTGLDPAKRTTFSGVSSPLAHSTSNRDVDSLDQFCIMVAVGPGKCEYDPDEGVSLQVPCDSNFPVGLN